MGTQIPHALRLLSIFKVPFHPSSVGSMTEDTEIQALSGPSGLQG